MESESLWGLELQEFYGGIFSRLFYKKSDSSVFCNNSNNLDQNAGLKFRLVDSIAYSKHITHTMLCSSCICNCKEYRHVVILPTKWMRSSDRKFID